MTLQSKLYTKRTAAAWRSHGHVLMSCSRGFYVTGSGFVIRRIHSLVRRAVLPLTYRLNHLYDGLWAEYPAPKNAKMLGTAYRTRIGFYFNSPGHDLSVHYFVKRVSHAHLLRVA